MKTCLYPLLILLALVAILGGCSSSSPTTSPILGDEASPLSYPGDPSGFSGPVSPSDPVRNLNPDELPKWAEDEVLVVLHDGEDPDSLYVSARGLGLSLIREIKLMWGTVYRLHIDTGQSVESVVEELKKWPEVDIAEPNFLLYPASVPYYPNDALFENPNDPDDDPWNHMYDQWGPNMLGASLVWPTQKGSQDIIVAVLDSGYRYTHEDLVNQIWINEDEIPDNGIDDDNNGYIDDWHGWDFNAHDNDPWDTMGHGTACSGVVAAEQDNGVGCTGIAPGVKVMVCKINLQFAGLVSSVVEAGQYAYDNGAHMVSMSFRNWEYSEIFHNIFIAIWDDGNGLLPIGAAGNENNENLTYPANFPEVFMVGATCSFYESGQRRDVKRLTAADYGWGSSYGENLEIMAPGELYITTRNTSDNSYYDGPGGTFSGTSNATPCIAGSAALVFSENPGWTAAQVRDRMTGTADDIHEPGRDNESGFGRVNIYRALYGSEPNSADYDVNGHLPIATDFEWTYDNIYDITTSAEYDFEDIFVLTSQEEGVMFIDVDIITTGQDLDIEIYDDAALTNLIDSATGANNFIDPIEQLLVWVGAGETYYIRVVSPGVYNCSTFRIRAKVEPYFWSLDWESIAPVYIVNESTVVPLLKLEITSNLGVTVDEIKTYITEGMPLELVNSFILYNDSNGSGSWENGFDTAIQLSLPSVTGLNLLPFTGLGLSANLENPLTLFVVANVGPMTEGTFVHFGAGLRSYKDVTLLEDSLLIDDPFPFQSDGVKLLLDNQPPYWNSTVGVQNVKGLYNSARLYWNMATDLYSGPVSYNVYYDQNDPPAIGTASFLEDVPVQSGGVFDHSTLVSGLIQDLPYFFCVRAQDTQGNEDNNLIWLPGIPNANSDPENPQVLSSLTLNGGYASEIWVHDKIAYVANGNEGLAIVDCNDPANPVHTDTYPAWTCRAVAYHTTQNYVYIATTEGLEIIDPNGAEGPVQIGNLPGSIPMDLFIDGDRCYLAVGSVLWVVDVSTPETPSLLGQIDLGWFVTIQEVWAQGDYAYVAASPGLHIIDVSDPGDLQDVKNLTLGYSTYEIKGWGDYVLVSQRFLHTLYVVDITDPLNAFTAGIVDVGEGYATEVAIRDESYVYLGTLYTTLFAIDWSNIGSMSVPGSVATDGAEGLFYDGEHLYTAESTYGMKIFI